MRSERLTRQCALFAGGLAIIGMGALVGCSKNDSDEVPASPSNTSSTSPSASPTEKGIGPGSGGSFTPTVKPALPTGQAGQVSGGR